MTESEQIVQKLWTYCNTLRDEGLWKAFEGRLVPNDPKDEPEIIFRPTTIANTKATKAPVHKGNL